MQEQRSLLKQRQRGITYSLLRSSLFWPSNSRILSFLSLSLLLWQRLPPFARPYLAFTMLSLLSPALLPWVHSLQPPLAWQPLSPDPEPNGWQLPGGYPPQTGTSSYFPYFCECFQHCCHQGSYHNILCESSLLYASSTPLLRSLPSTPHHHCSQSLSSVTV